MKESFTIPFLVFLCIVSNGYCHGDLHERIQKLSSEIEIYSDSSDLYLTRGSLFYQHEKYDESIQDLKKCLKLDHNSSHLNLALAKTHLKLEQPKIALKYLNKTLKTDPFNVLALRWKGKSLLQLNQFDKAAENFEAVIEHADKTFTENYIEASFAWQQDDNIASFDKAVAIFEKGIQDLGPLLMFYNKLVSLHAEAGKYENAIKYQNAIISLSNRKERSYYQRAMIYMEQGDSSAARADLIQSKQEIEKLPQRIKVNNATKILIENIKKKENQLH